MPIPVPPYTDIDALPTAPSRGQQPEVFIELADAFVGALPTFRDQANQLAGDMVVLAQVALDEAAAAVLSASDAAAEAAAAAASAGDAAASAGAAAASAAAAAAASALTATTSTSMTFATGTKVLTLNETGKEFTAGQWVYLVDPADGDNRWLIGSITSFTSGTGNMTVEVLQFSGTGSHGTWNVYPASPVYASSSFLSNSGGTLTGNLGFNIASAGNLLHAHKTTAATSYAQFTNSGTGATLTDGMLVGVDATGKALINQQEAAAFGLVVNGTERFTVASNGAITFSSTSVTAGGNTVWHAGNFTPANKLDASANAVSATKLQTARLINGVAFDGTSDITITAGAGSFLPLTGGTLTGGLTGTTANFTSGLSMNGNAVWHAGNFTPSGYAQLASANFTVLQVGGNAVWHAGNLTPGNYALLAGATFTGAISSRGGDASTPLATQNNAASNATQFYVTHNGSETQVGNARGALNLFNSSGSRLLLNSTGAVGAGSAQFSGRVYGNTGSSEGNGLGRIYLSTGAPSGGAQGDIWCVY